jgi:hypothetical protein
MAILRRKRLVLASFDRHYRESSEGELLQRAAGLFLA